MDNPEKLVTQGTRQRNSKQNTTQYVLDTNMRKQTQITFIRHEPSLQTTGGKDEPNIVFMFLYFLFIILFQNVHGYTPGAKGKYPWIEYNGEALADSDFIIEYLNTKLGVDLDKTFSRRDIGTARAFQKMLEENTFWLVFQIIWFMVFKALSTIFQLLVYRGGQFYWWRKPEYPEKTTDLPQVADKLNSKYAYSASIFNIIVCLNFLINWYI